MIEVFKIGAKEWKEKFSDSAHLAVFKEYKPNHRDRIDFALLAVKDDKPAMYMQVREFDSETVYIQYGGAFEETKQTYSVFMIFQMFLRKLKEEYLRAAMYVENTNTAMIKLALAAGFVITGVRNFKQSILLECLLEF